MAEQSLGVALVSMPFAAFDRPSIQLGLLKAIGVARGYRVDTHHLNLNFVSPLGVTLYSALTNHRGRLIGDWLFSLAAFGSDAPDQDGAFLDQFWNELSYIHSLEGVDRESLMEIRRNVLPSLLDDLVESIEWGRYRIVGFTTTFQQNAASFALARRIEARYPKVSILFGGANFEDPMGHEWIRKLPWIDYAISGEADRAFPELLTAVFEDGEAEDIPGVLSARTNGKDMPPAPPFDSIDTLPIPDYQEYFERVESLELLTGKGTRRVTIPFESARGCWWGAKHHCTFCGLNGQTMTFRSKSGERVSKELAELAKRHSSFRLAAVDNIIDMRFYKSLLPTLVKEQSNYDIFYEIKSNVTRDQIRQMASAGIRQVQPGIESLSTPVLGLMRKGVTAIQNVNLLRWSQYYGVNATWNMIWGFPGEKLEYYEEQAELLPHVVHLRPPVGWARIWMERFSPLFREREAFPLKGDLRPEASYAYVYPETVNLNDIAYFFDYELEGSLPDEAYADTQALLNNWKAMWDKTEDRPYLVHRYAPGYIRIQDHRNPENPGEWTFEGPLAQLYMSCNERPRSAESILQEGEVGLAYEETEWSLNSFVERGLMMHDGGRYLCLSVPGSYSG